MSAAKGRPVSFEMTGVKNEDGTTRPVARFKCSLCPEIIDVAIRSGTSISPESLASVLTHKGWQSDPWRKQRIVCPTCTSKQSVNDPDSELRKFQEKQKEAAKAMPPPATNVVPVRKPTSEQRSMIRTLIEKHFDEEDGYYLDGYSDQQIATDLNVPRIMVEQLRETAYGPIRVSPEIMAARREVDSLRKALDVLTAHNDKLTTDILALTARLEKLEENLKAA